MAAIPFNPGAQVIFVGGGPIALWTAVNTKLRSPQLQIDILEKHAAYQRTNTLSLKKESFAGASNDPRLQAIIREFLQNKQIRTHLIEESLSGLAEQIGIRILRNVHIVNPLALRAHYPNAKVIVGADGAHSIVRNIIFQNEMSFEKDFKYLLELKYEVLGQSQALGAITELYPTLKAMGAIAREHIGPLKNGRSSVTLRLFIDRKKFEHMQNANFRHPYTFENEALIHQRIKENMRIWLNVKAQNGERRVVGSEKITVTRLGIYASKSVVKVDQGVTWCLVGDAAFGVPFFRGFNNGALCGAKLAKKIVQALDPSQAGLIQKICCCFKRMRKEPFLSYSLFVKYLARKEIFVAWIKSILIDVMLFFVRISARVPWQSNYWSEAQIKRFRVA